MPSVCLSIVLNYRAFFYFALLMDFLPIPQLYSTNCGCRRYSSQYNLMLKLILNGAAFAKYVLHISSLERFDSPQLHMITESVALSWSPSMSVL